MVCNRKRLSEKGEGCHVPAEEVGGGFQGEGRRILQRGRANRKAIGKKGR